MDVRDKLFDYSDRNEFLERQEAVLFVPAREDVERSDPDVYMKRLAEISSPSERLREFLYDLINIYGTDQKNTHETTWTRYMFLSGAFGGWVVGGLLTSRGLHEEYIRNNNAAVFSSKYRSSRHRTDTFLYAIATRGLKRGIAVGLLCASVGIISFGSINYRNQLYYPDWAVGFTILGAVSRLWVSPKAIAMGGALGLVAGTFGYGLARLEEKLSGVSVAQIRYLTHAEFVSKREARLPKFQRMRDEHNKDVFQNMK